MSLNQPKLSPRQWLEQGRRVERICSQFELSWRDGRSKTIEKTLAQTLAADYDRALEELLAIEFELLFHEGTLPELAGYLQRFPRKSDVVTRVYQAVATDHQSLLQHEETEGYQGPSDKNGRYEIGDEIGRGGMGVVYRCRDLTCGRPLALKTLLLQHQCHRAAAQRFECEAQITARFQHPGVPSVYDLGQLHDGRPFMVMQLVEGRTMAAILRTCAESGTTETDRRMLLGILHQVSQTMKYAHSLDIIHRDLKPANVIVCESDEVAVIDWGLATELASDTQFVRKANRTQSIAEGRQEDSGIDTAFSLKYRVSIQGTNVDAPGFILGTLSYMPPEQACGHACDLDKRADVFSLGAMLCEVLTGHPPYWQEAGRKLVRRPAWDVDLRLDTAALADRRMDLAARRLQECHADRELVRLTLDCLQVNREARPADAGQIAQLLDDSLRSVDARQRQVELDRIKAAEA